MAVDISAELEVISGNEYGEDVIEAIRSASLKLGQYGFYCEDLDTLLDIIKNSTYGKDIRLAIYEVLRQLSTNSSLTPYNVITNVIMNFPGVVFGTVGEMEAVQDGN